MVVTAGISYQFTSQLRGDAVEVDRTLETLRENQKLRVSLGDFTISAGRYIITRDERTLDNREAVKAAIQVQLEQMRSLADDSTEKDLIAQIARLHATRIEMSEAIIAGFRERIRSGELPTAGEPSPLGTEYPAIGAEIEGLVKMLEAHEYAQLEIGRASCRERV